jgi:hypothetical protein
MTTYFEHFIADYEGAAAEDRDEAVESQRGL